MGKGSKGTMGNKEVCGIYGYYDNLKDKIIYVGQSQNINDRHKQHLAPSNRLGQPVNKILQSNPLRYNLIILKECAIDELNHWEMTLIALFNPLFNFNNGGDGNRGFHHSEETKQLLSNKLKGRIVSEEERRKKSGVNHPLFGKKHKAESIKKMSEVKLGSKNPMYGRKQSESAKEKVRQHKLGAKNPMYNPYPNIIKNGKSGDGKQLYSIVFHHKRILQSVNREFLEDYLDKYWDDIIEGKPTPKLKYKPKQSPFIKKGARVIKNGFDCGKQRYQLVHDGKRLQCSVFKDKLQKLADEINAKT